MTTQYELAELVISLKARIRELEEENANLREIQSMMNRSPSDEDGDVNLKINDEEYRKRRIQRMVKELFDDRDSALKREQEYKKWKNKKPV